MAIPSAGALLLLAGCGIGPSAGSAAAHTKTPTTSTRAAILRGIESAFFSTTGAPPDLRITRLEEAVQGATE